MKFKRAILLLSLFFYSCVKESNEIVDTKFSNPPFITSFSIQPAEVNLDTIFITQELSPDDTLLIKFTLSASVYDKDGYDDIRSVFYSAVNPNFVTLKNGILNKLSDSVFSGSVELKIKRKEAGDYLFKIFADDKSGNRSNEINASVNLYRLNRPPVISNLSAPDTVYVQTETVLIKMTLKASDPDGNNDIKVVQFNAYRPDGTPSSGNPFRMYDDGNANGISGDAKAGDGIYSIIIQLPPNTQKGKYKFEFMAIDRANQSSNVITHFMTVL